MATLRFFQPSDSKSVLDIYAYYVLNSVITFETVVPEFEEFSQRLQSVADRYPFLIAESEGRIVGYAYASEYKTRAAYRWCVESSVYLSEELRSKGVGTMLYKRLFEILKTRHFCTIYAGITLPNTGSEILHRNFGFTELAVHRKTGFKHGAWHDVLWMQKVINPYDAHPKEPIFSHSTP